MRNPPEPGAITLPDLSAFEERVWCLANDRSLALGPMGHVMGVLNITPDSFSDGGVYEAPDQAASRAVAMVGDGATILDLGAESTKPGATEIDGEIELKRLTPALSAVQQALPDTLISIDTYRAATAAAALEQGAHIINDVWGLQREPDIAHVAAEHRAGLVIMHTNRGRTALDDVIEDQKEFFARSLDIALEAGIDDGQIVLDPGFGFGKETAELNLELMERFEALHKLGFPFLIGTSRKRFLGAVTGKDAVDRDAATAATTAILRQKGAAIFRVHDVAMNVDALKLVDAMIDVGRNGGALENLQ